MMSEAVSLDELAHGAADNRLARALVAREATPIGHPDLVALTRAAAVGRGYASVLVPQARNWPDVQDWRAASFEVDESHPQNAMLVVTPRPWLPAWADSGVPPDVAAASGERRQPNQAVPGDPFLPRISGGSQTYRTPAQREAIRTVLAATSGETVLAVLPTGSGKTLVATAPAFLASPKVTLMVVPTVALALDIERRLQGEYGLEYPVAYHGDMSQSEKTAFRERLKEREQWIVVTSPEAATTSLAPTLERLAEGGNLAYFVIDEAHILTSWGGSFRPAFRALAGLRRRLNSLASSVRANFTTVLLTGTLDDHGRRLLELLFADGELTLIAAQATRPEPAYWSVHCETEEQKKQALLEALRHLPRPTLVYTSLVSGTQSTNVQDVANWLREAGFNRLMLVTGTSNAQARRNAVSSLRGEGSVTSDCDVVVASSAFGLGIDIDGVRSVVHACVPESIDRFYQEVGRGGRDGKASISLLIHTPNDRHVAQGLSAAANIGPEKAWLHWKAMRDGARLGGDRLTVSLTAAHSGIVRPASDANVNWNLHTLTMMELEGMIRLHWSSSVEVPESASDEDLDVYFEAHFKKVEIELVDGNLDNESIYKSRFLQVRDATGSAVAASLSRMDSLVDGIDRCTNSAFAMAYCLHEQNGDVVHVDPRCGGCRECRKWSRPPWTGGGLFPEPYVRRDRTPLPLRLADLVSGGRSCSLTYRSEGPMPWEQIEVLLRRIVEAGVQLLVVPVGGQQTLERCEERIRARWFASDLLGAWLASESPSPLHTAVVLPPDCGNDQVVRMLRHVGDVASLLVIHEFDQRGPSESKRFLREILRPSTDIVTALGRI